MLCKFLSSHPQLLAVRLDVLGLSILKKTIIIVQEVCRGHTIKPRQILSQFLGDMLGNPLLNRFVHAKGDF